MFVTTKILKTERFIYKWYLNLKCLKAKMEYKVRKIDKEYQTLVKGMPKDVTYRHLSIVFFILSIPVLGNLLSLIMAINCRVTKGW